MFLVPIIVLSVVCLSREKEIERKGLCRENADAETKGRYGNNDIGRY